mgnify:CR=1 FL=1
MHISEGVLSGPVLLTGGVLTVAGTAIGLKKLDFERIARAGILSSAFFVASLIHVPVGPSSVHLILNGIVGLILGWGAFPAILVALFLQGMLFQFGGLTTLGVNTLIMALPAVVCYYSFGPLVQRDNRVALPAAGSAWAHWTGRPAPARPQRAGDRRRPVQRSQLHRGPGPVVDGRAPSRGVRRGA